MKHLSYEKAIKRILPTRLEAFMDNTNISIYQSLEGYYLQGIIYDKPLPDKRNSHSMLEGFINKLPEDAVCVVDFKESDCYLSGTVIVYDKSSSDSNDLNELFLSEKERRELDVYCRYEGLEK